MNTQINLRLSPEFIKKANKQAKLKGFSSLQEFIKDALREKVYPEELISNQELELIKNLIKVSEKNSLYGTEKELFEKLNN
ncbi:MAG: ribbon-helix-helix domain-containing protein [Nanoarchaeota archaeon]